MASTEGSSASGSGSGPEKKRAPPASHPQSASAAPKATPETPKSASATPPAAPKPVTSKAAPEAAAAGGEDLVVVTMKASTGSIVRIEVAKPDGSRHEISASETARLSSERPTFSSLVHDAFEAGIACVLDDGPGDEASGESEEDVDLHDALLDALIERSAAKRLLSREILTSAVLGTIIREASNGAAPRHA